MFTIQGPYLARTSDRILSKFIPDKKLTFYANLIRLSRKVRRSVRHIYGRYRVSFWKMSKTNPPRTGGICSTDDTSGPERSLSSRRTLRLRRPHTLRAIFSGEKFHRICHPWKILLPDVQTAKWLFGVRGFFRKRRFSSNEILSILDAKNGSRQNEFLQIVMLCLS